MHLLGCMLTFHLCVMQLISKYLTINETQHIRSLYLCYSNSPKMLLYSCWIRHTLIDLIEESEQYSSVHMENHVSYVFLIEHQHKGNLLCKQSYFIFNLVRSSDNLFCYLHSLVNALVLFTCKSTNLNLITYLK